ncbi:tol-pal system-associated acyl-CoA thioesterase [Aliiglaciecola sp. 3_MG-2023]|uniref:tol-pal system-associated acyl-CoA thioesterase n=1 Tax=Aliiglaciecola sp. 3_MG-2023 TaxID=3062644 RepID=UPI0026E4780D|nr:tol-pal system-associated acyl-CoA thioesterase [Aliiglaciecola sp. 3_MG-2023]MDO6691650.1 tol-pal system-associated acyl-CoA thioesterase [Aliiglaciecola sp. 3_MG-2023]
MPFPVHKFNVRVYYEDTDAGGIVYYANYLKFFERARTEWLRSFGIEQHSLLEQSVGFVVKRVEMDNIAAAKFDDFLQINTQIIELKRASMLFQQQITNSNNLSLVSAKIRVACVDLQKMKPIAIPAFILGEISSVI